LSQGERTRRIGVAEGNIIGDVSLGPALTYIVRGRVQRGGLQQEVSPSSFITIIILQTDSHNNKINIVRLLFICFYFGFSSCNRTLECTHTTLVVLLALYVFVSGIMYALASGKEQEDRMAFCFQLKGGKITPRLFQHTSLCV